MSAAYRLRKASSPQISVRQQPYSKKYVLYHRAELSANHLGRLVQIAVVANSPSEV